MILYSSDWDLHPMAKPDFTTTNASFLRIATILKKLSPKNYLFPLALHDQSLIDIDPYDPTLTPEQQTKIAVECMVNPWYYFREVARAPAMAGSDAVPIRANRMFISSLWLYFAHCTTVVVSIRQVGKSFMMDQLVRYLVKIRCRNTEIDQLTRNGDLRRKTIARIKEIDDCFPDYLNSKTRDDSANTFEFSCLALKNIMTSHLPGSSEKQAEALGRGISSATVLTDESPFTPRSHISIPAALGAVGAAQDAAKAAGEPYGIIFGTTAGKISNPEGAFMHKMAMEAAPWTESYFQAKNQDEFEQTIRSASRTITGKERGVFRVYMNYNHRQLGYTDEWLLDKIEKAGGTKESILMDFFAVWGSGTLLSPIPESAKELINSSVMEPIQTEVVEIHFYTTNYYVSKEELMKRIQRSGCVLSIDPSEAAGGDGMDMLIQDLYSGETLFTCDITVASILTFSRWLYEVLIKPNPKLIVMIERKSTGSSIIDNLIEFMLADDIDPMERMFNRLFNERKEDLEAAYDEYIRLKRSGRLESGMTQFRKYIGYPTSGRGKYSRDNLYGANFTECMKTLGHVFYGKQLVNQILALVIINGRIDHPPSGHDDLVICLLMCHFLATRGSNLGDYGIDVSRIYKEIPATKEDQKKLDNQSVSEKVMRSAEDLLERRFKSAYAKLVVEIKEHVKAPYRDTIQEKNRLKARLRFTLDNLQADIDPKNLEQESERKLIHDFLNS